MANAHLSAEEANSLMISLEVAVDDFVAARLDLEKVRERVQRTELALKKARSKIRSALLREESQD